MSLSSTNSASFDEDEEDEDEDEDEIFEDLREELLKKLDDSRNVQSTLLSQFIGLRICS